MDSHLNEMKTIRTSIEEGYFDTLGINVVEIMPVNEFEGDKSWGYNPSFYLAPESSYGTPDELKLMINKFHEHGIAVLMDVVFNHMWGSAPLFQLYQPLNNWDYRAHDYEHCPYFHNRESPWGYKLEHWHGLTPAGYPRRTWKYVTDCLKMWVEEYHIDGFRFDHTEGIGWDPNGKNGMNFYASYLEELDPRITITWEDAGLIPYSYNPVTDYDPETPSKYNWPESVDETIEYSKKLAMMRGNREFAMVPKGFTSLRWQSEFENHGTFILGERSARYCRNRLDQRQARWDY